MSSRKNQDNNRKNPDRNSKNSNHKSGISLIETVKLAVIILVIAGMAAGLASPMAAAFQQHLGLDLKGGVHVVYQAVPTPDSPVTDDSITRLIAVIRNRVDALGVTEPNIQKEGSDRVVIELPGVEDPEEAVKIIGKTAHLEFKTETGETVLTGKDLKDAQAQLNPANEPEVMLQFDEEGTKKFGEMTTANVQKPIAIFLDDELLTAPIVSEPITTGEAVISGGYQSLEEAQNEAVLLRSGALPVKVELLEKRSVGPTLGQDSLDRSMNAGIIACLIIFIFMVLYYRVPGIVAVLSLFVYGLIVGGVFILIKATLTLPGIAGFLLSVGMAVDANIIIYERLKEELRAGKTLRSAIDAGFKHAFRAILDANVTTLIAAAVLYVFGTGSIRGFAVTLSIGILTSMFTAITFTRYMLHLLAKSRLVLNVKAYGA